MYIDLDGDHMVESEDRALAVNDRVPVWEFDFLGINGGSYANTIGNVFDFKVSDGVDNSLADYAYTLTAM